MRIILSESQIANLLKKKYNFDLDGKVQKITEFEQLPEEVRRALGKGPFNQYLNMNVKSSGKITPFYLIDFGDDSEKKENIFLYHEGPSRDNEGIPKDQLRGAGGNEPINYDSIYRSQLVKIENGRLNLYDEKKFKEEYNIPNIGFSLTEIFDLYT